MRGVSAVRFGGPEVLAVSDKLSIPCPADGGPSSVQSKFMRAASIPLKLTFVQALMQDCQNCRGLQEMTVRASLSLQVTMQALDFLANAYGSLALYLERTLSIQHAYQLTSTRSLDNLSMAQGAAVGIAYKTAYRALFHRARVTPDKLVFVHGASGGVGIAAVQLAVLNGLYVIGSAGTQQGLENRHGRWSALCSQPSR